MFLDIKRSGIELEFEPSETDLFLGKTRSENASKIQRRNLHEVN